LLAYSCLALWALLCGVVFTFMAVESVNEYNLGRRVQRALTSVRCASCGEGSLSVTANPVWVEPHQRIPGRYVICRKCDSAFFAAPAGTHVWFATGTHVAWFATPAGLFELMPVDAPSLKQRIRQRRIEIWRFSTKLVCAGLGLGIWHTASSYWALHAADGITIILIVGVLLFLRRKPLR
jgi:hypothetical protein